MLRRGSEMTAADVVYADVNFTKSRGETPGETSSAADTTYSEVKIKQPSDAQKLVSSAAGSKVTSERVALAVLAALLAAATVALVAVSLNFTQTKDSLHHMEDLNRNLTERYDELKETLDKKSCPAAVNTTLPCPPCPVDWEEHGGQCYLFSGQRLNWTLARKQCQQQGADLVRIDSEDEQTFLTMRLNEKMDDPEDKFWIGLTDADTEGHWLWVDGSPLNQSLTFWQMSQKTPEPDNWDYENPVDGEDCARMGEKSNTIFLPNWFDKDCNFSQKSICEKAAVRGHLFCV